RFFVLFPHLAGNKFIISGGSYGGVYVPNIATVIHRQNLLIARGAGQPGAIHINLEALVLSNPLSSPLAHFQWLLHYRCKVHQIHNSTVCSDLYAELPACLENIEMALEVPTVKNRVAAWEFCATMLERDTNGTVVEDIRRTCTCTPPDPANPAACHPEFEWLDKIFANPAVKAALGVPHDWRLVMHTKSVHRMRIVAGPAYSPSYVVPYAKKHKLNRTVLKTPFQEEFIAAPDVPWPSKEIATVCSVGAGAGNMAYILVAEPGHFVNQPGHAKLIIIHWVSNRPFVDVV
ncbi:Alpha/Beta hydrolase protein, partial [Mycena rebaudengoi]